MAISKNASFKLVQCSQEAVNTIGVHSLVDFAHVPLRFVPQEWTGARENLRPSLAHHTGPVVFPIFSPNQNLDIISPASE
jgi:hypothetical protein